MAEYYKYVARDADSQINYAELGQQAVGELQNWYNTREEKKEAYKQAARESVNNLMDAPQGKDQNANDFISKYAQKMIDQKMVDKNLFERGLISEKDYTLRMQNQMDGTKRLFNLQKLYQQEFETTMQGINDKKLQRSFTISNQSDVEGAANFNNSEAFINPDDGSVSVGLMENKVIDGKVVRVLNPNTSATTAVWSGKILQKPAYFDVNSETTDFVKNLGDLKDAVYSAALTSKAGTITELTGVEFLKTNIKDPATRAIVENFNNAVDLEVESYFAGNTLNVASILGDETGKYNFKSFTFDRELADKDPTKILKTIDPVTQMPILDETGKHYQAQLAEAKAYVKTQILGKLDNERKISTTSQLELQERRPKTSDELGQANMERDAKNFAVNTQNLLYGDDAKKKEAIGYFVGMGADIISNPAGKPKGNYIRNEAGKYVPFETNGNPSAAARAIIGPLLAATGQSFPQDIVFKNIKVGPKFNTSFSGTGLAAERPVKKEFETRFNQTFSSELFRDSESKGVTSELSNKLSKLPSVQIQDTGGLLGNTIKFTVGKKSITLDSRSKKLAKNQKEALRKFIINNVPESELEEYLGAEKGTNEIQFDAEGNIVN